jgi:DDE superfamily endonuclease
MRSKNLSKPILDDIFDRYVSKRHSSARIFRELFKSEENVIKRRYLFDLCNKFRKFGKTYELRSFKSIGRPRKMSRDDTEALMVLLIMNPFISSEALRLLYFDDHYGRRHGDDLPEKDTILRAIRRARFSLKVSEKRSFLVDPHEILGYLETIAFIKPSNILDIDGINNNPESFLEKRGWAPIGTESVRFQLQVGGISYWSLAGMTENGFVAWKYDTGTCTGDDVASFITDEISTAVTQDTYVIIDNASVNKTDEAIRALDVTLGGRYKFSPRYYPRLKPIERAFSMVRKYIRQKEASGYLNNIGSRGDLINEAFTVYSIWGSRGNRCKRLFDRYRNNHKVYVESF